MRKLSLMLPALACAMAVSPLFAQGEFKDLVRRVPSSANALVLVDSQKIMSSPIAKKEDWKSKIHQAYAAGLTILPPDANQGVFALNLDLSLMVPSWEVVILDLDHDPNVAGFAKRIGATVEKLEKLDAVQMPGDAFAVSFGKRIVGAMSPGNRQSVGRWLREVAGRQTPGLSAYLLEAYGFSENFGTPIIMALDLENVTTVPEVRAMLANSEKYKALAPEKLEELATFVAGIRGLTLGVTFIEGPYGKVKVDFTDNVPLSPAVAKEALLTALKKRGVMLDELEQWTAKVSGKQISLEGPMTSSGLRRLFSLVSPAPSFRPASVESTGSAQPNTPEESKQREASKVYLSNVQSYLRDLYSDKRDAVTQGQIAMWYDTYARKLDMLPTLNVDPELKAFGAFAADAMRSACASLRNASASADVRTKGVQPVFNEYQQTSIYGFSTRYDNYGNSYTVPVGTTGTYYVENRREEERQKREIRAQESTAGYKSANDAMQAVDAKLAQVRASLSAKYKVQF